MDKIICICGESGSGKTTLCKELEKEGYNIIKSYTTRKPRCENEYGHIFVNSKNYKFNRFNDGTVDIFKYIGTDDIYGDLYIPVNHIAYTYFDNYNYWATKEQYQGHEVNIYVIDVAGVKELKERVTDAEIVVIYLNVDENYRYARMFDREDDLSKIRERIKHDREAFKIVPCDYSINANKDIKEVLENVKLIIEGI